MEEAGIPILGAIPRSAALRLPERHLGLVQAAEQADLDQIVDCMADIVATHVDLNAIRRAARFATPQNHAAMPLLAPPGKSLATPRAEDFSFTFAPLLSSWRAAGAELLPFSPSADKDPGTGKA